VIPAMPPSGKNVKGLVRTVPGNMRVKFQVRSFNSFGAFSTQNFRGHVTLATPPFRINCKASSPDCPWKYAVKFEVRIFNRFGAISILRPKFRG